MALLLLALAALTTEVAWAQSYIRTSRDENYEAYWQALREANRLQLKMRRIYSEHYRQNPPGGSNTSNTSGRDGDVNTHNLSRSQQNRIQREKERDSQPRTRYIRDAYGNRMKITEPPRNPQPERHSSISRESRLMMQAMRNPDPSVLSESDRHKLFELGGEAIGACDDVLKANPENYVAYQYMARIYALMGKTQEKGEAILKANEILARNAQTKPVEIKDKYGQTQITAMIDAKKFDEVDLFLARLDITHAEDETVGRMITRKMFDVDLARLKDGKPSGEQMKIHSERNAISSKVSSALRSIKYLNDFTSRNEAPSQDGNPDNYMQERKEAGSYGSRLEERVSQAEKNCDQLEELAPESAIAPLLRSRISRAQGKTEEARQYVSLSHQRLLQASANGTPPRASLLKTVGQYHLEDGSVQELEALLGRIETQFPDNEYVQLTVTRLLMDADRVKSQRQNAAAGSGSPGQEAAPQPEAPSATSRH